MLSNLHERGTVTWVTRIQSILCENGFEQVWLFGCGQEKLFFRELKERLHSSFCFRWYDHVENSSRFSIYKQYKTCFGKEKYVDILWMNIYRNVLAQFRMGVSQINVHKYRYSKKTENWECPFCTKTLETEEHFIFECPKYVDVRLKYLQIIVSTEYPVNGNLHVMKLCEEKVLDFAKFLFYAFKLRSQALNES